MNQRQPRPEGHVNDRRGQENGRPPAPRRQGQGRDRPGAYEKRFRKIYLSLVAILLAFILVFSFMIRGKIRGILGQGEPTEPAEFDVFPYHSLTGNGGGSSQATSENDLTSDYSLPPGWGTVNPAPIPPTFTNPPIQPGSSSTASSTSPTQGSETDPTTGTDIEDPTETTQSPEISETETPETETVESSRPSTEAESSQPTAGDAEAGPVDDD
ncbi:MAG: hypothetical protein GX849_03775 [Clostridiaceae bacterium]|nr:hypothetical protein [Clostridiaceae bacterium]